MYMYIRLKIYYIDHYRLSKNNKKDQHVPRECTRVNFRLNSLEGVAHVVSNGRLFQSIAPLNEKLRLYKFLFGLGSLRSTSDVLKLYFISVSDSLVKRCRRLGEECSCSIL